MPSLRELQRDFGRALLGGPVDAAAGAIADGGVPAPARLGIYRHHVLESLTGVLRAAFPVVCRLVDRPFFDYAADAFIRRHPPAGPCLDEYGAAFPPFLADFSPCRHLAYLPDVARLEWAIHRAQRADDAVPLRAGALSEIDPERVGDLTFRFDPSLALVDSRWPIEAIWGAHQGTGEIDPVDLDAGGDFVQVHRRDDGVLVRALTADVLAFRRVLAEGGRLAEAVASAAAGPTFDLVEALHALFREEVLTGFTLSPKEHS